MSQRFIVGVAGGSGSGKTTIVEMLRQHHGEDGHNGKIPVQGSRVEIEGSNDACHGQNGQQVEHV